MNVVLWILQILLGIYFTLIGVMHFIIPPGLPAQMSWMYDLSPTLHAISGGAEILGGLGLILPSVTRIKTWLTPLAALGLSIVMVLAIFYHLQRGETMNIGFNVVLAALSAFIAYGRWKLAPLAERSASS
jgi:putative oxidoreductase